MKNSLFIFTSCLSHHSHLVHWEQLPAVCSFSHFSCNLQETSQDTSFWLGLSPRTPAHPMAHWCCGAALSILQMNTDLVVVPLRLASPGILALHKFDWLINWKMFYIYSQGYVVWISTQLLPDYYVQALAEKLARLATKWCSDVSVT